jgi:hypothetical protein
MFCSGVVPSNPLEEVHTHERPNSCSIPIKALEVANLTRFKQHFNAVLLRKPLRMRG